MFRMIEHKWTKNGIRFIAAVNLWDKYSFLDHYSTAAFMVFEKRMASLVLLEVLVDEWRYFSIFV